MCSFVTFICWIIDIATFSLYRSYTHSFISLQFQIPSKPNDTIDQNWYSKVFTFNQFQDISNIKFIIRLCVPLLCIIDTSSIFSNAIKTHNNEILFIKIYIIPIWNNGDRYKWIKMNLNQDWIDHVSYHILMIRRWCITQNQLL